MTKTDDCIHDEDDARLKAVLRTVVPDAPKLDAALLDAIEQQATHAFAAAVGSQETDAGEKTESEFRDSASSPNSSHPANGTTATNVKTTMNSTRRRQMFTLAFRGLCLASAMAAMLVAWLAPINQNGVSHAAAFSDVINNVRSASSLHLQIVRDGQTAEVWVRSPGLVRREQSAQRYEIAAGSRLWRIDEEANTAHETDSPWFQSSDRQVDLVALLDVGITDVTALLNSRPTDRAQFEGRDCLVYRAQVQTEAERIELQGFVDAKTLQLAGLRAKRGPNILLAEMRLIAMNEAVADDKFVVAKSLTEDGRIGKVSDSQGIAVIRPMLAKRWTPLGPGLLLKPGDWLRTELRGANGLKVTLSSDVELTLGPGTLVECISPTQARLHMGEVQVNYPERKVVEESVPFTLLAPREGKRVFKHGKKKLVRVDREEKLVDVAQTPVWLAGFEGTSNNESLGSLIVKLPDGRNEPLTVGYHKVSVEIRDQIARTTIEESFVNHTPSRLEGVFHFPLPQDASISGFGMWIGNDLVEADIVEKQRAREIYETILRENRDPGLLEWTAGNLFKARVFPIEAHSEKRVKIVYTQVLPLRANRYRYSYGLRSDLLRTKPLRELALTVTVNSALPLKRVSCPTHTVRTQQTAHSAQVEFAAQEYSPNRDFEVVCEIDAKQSDVVVIPHRRGDDGYLLVQLTPPGPEGNWQRELLPDGKALNIVLLCDTSASMDSEKRKQQSEFVATVLSSLGADDRFLLGAIDVGTSLAFPELSAPSAENIAGAKDFLDKRASLGWTNLDRGLADVVKKSPVDAQVIYIGDGIVSAGDTDPARFVKRLAAIVGQGGNQPNTSHRSFHAVSVGNISESTVLKGIASVGGGSVRSIGGEQSGLVVAKELLNEIAQPGLRDINVEFRGLKVAAVYPERLPNVAAGTQQILVGRYLPEGKDQVGEIIVTGKRGTEAVRYAAKINFKEAEEGNSFIPRLWARGHLDHLLAQGQAAAVKDEIIGLSEQFHIITPLTSLLVLETDADRERFGVKRRYEMRDGERFFAEGRNHADFELVQQQMKRAGDWRQGIRRQILKNLAGLGRNPQLFREQLEEARRASSRDNFLGDGPYPISLVSAVTPASGRLGGLPGGAGGGYGGDLFFAARDFDGDQMEVGQKLEVSDSRTKFSGDRLDSISANEESPSFGFGKQEQESDRKEVSEGLKRLRDSIEDFGWEDKSERQIALQDESGFIVRELGKAVTENYSYRGGRSRGTAMPSEPFQSLAGGLMFKAKGQKSASLGRYYESQQSGSTTWLNNLYPTLPSRPGKPAPALPDPEGWSAEALTLSRSLLRVEPLSRISGGLELKRTVDSFDPRWKRQSAHNTDLVLYSPTGWLTRTLDADEQTVIHYATPQDRGAFSLALLLGRVRASAPGELTPGVLGFNDSSLDAVHVSYRGYQAKVEPAGENRVKLILSQKNSTYEQHLLIDTVRHVVVKYEAWNEGKVTSTTTLDDFVEVAGTWLARRRIDFDGKGRKTGETILDLKVLTVEEYAARMAAEMAPQSTVQFQRLPLQKLSVARQKVADGTAGFDDRITMIMHFASLQQWEEVLKQIDAIEALVAGDVGTLKKPGVRWIRTAALIAMRRNEEARQRLLKEARTLFSGKLQDDVYLADFIHSQATQVGTGSETLELVTLLKPVYERQPESTDVMDRWQEQYKQVLDALGRTEEALALKKSMTEKSPWHIHWQQDVANRLRNSGRYDEAETWLRKEISRDVERHDYEDETLRSTLADLFRTRGQWDRLLAFTTEWIARNPESNSWSSAYAQHLSTLIFNDKFDLANGLVEQWLKESRVDGKLTAAQNARLETAIRFAQGTAHNLSFQRADERWVGILAETVRFFVRHPHHGEIAPRIFNHHYFQQSDGCDRLRGEFLHILRTDLANLTPAQLSFLVSSSLGGRLELVEPINDRKQLQAHEVPLDIWKKIAAEVRTRWAKTKNDQDRDSLGTTLSTIYSSRFYDTELLPFLRERIATAPADLKPGYRDILFTDLLSRAWTDEIEQEAFQVLQQLSGAHEADATMIVQIPSLHRLVDAMLAIREAKSEKLLGDAGEVNKLTRTELAKKRSESRKANYAALLLRLATEADKEDAARGPLAVWMRMEQMWLDIQLEQNFDKAEERCWTLLGEVPPKPDLVVDEDDGEPRAEDAKFDPRAATLKQLNETLDSLLKQRALATVMNLAARRTATPATIERVLKYIEAGIVQSSPDVKRDGYVKEAYAEAQAAWRTTKFQMLIALDRPDDLERDLRTWIRQDQSTSPWRQSLARLLAERGKLDEGIQLFESVEKDKLLSASDYRMLSDWYLVTNRRADYERAKLAAFKQTPEGNLSNSLYHIRNRWYQSNVPLPSELDENTLLTFKALFEKSANPESYLWHLREIYAASRDFRLLQMIPDAVLGRSPQQVYAYLNNLNSQVLYELRNEASADEILARVKSLRVGERTVTDLRALDLLEALVERKSSEVLNQPGPHVTACLAALHRAFDRNWQPGEPRLMSDFLYKLGSITNVELAAEQVRELKALQTQAPAASRDRLYITNDLCNLLGGNYGKRDEAIQMMELEVRDYAQANGGQWPHEDNSILGSFVSLYEGGNRHAAGEAVLLKWIAATKHNEQRKYLRDRLMSLYNHALEHKGEVTLGKDAELFNRIIDLGLKDIDAAADEHERYNVVTRICATFDIAQRNKIGDFPGRLAKFVFESLPEILKKQQSQYRNTVSAPVHVTGTSLSPYLALRYIVERLEQYPQRFDMQWDNGWQGFGYELARRREAAANELGNLEPRVLVLAIRELKRHLRTDEARNYYIYYKHHSHFWAEKAADYAEAANEVYAEYKTSGRRVRSIANYFRNGLEMRARAIEILMIAHGNGLLDESAQAELVTFLQVEGRYAESIPLLEGLAKAQPDSMTYRTQLMAAYHNSQRPEQLATLVKQIDTHFHANGRWTEGNIATFGKGCLGCNLTELAVGYLNEAISLHQRDRGGRTLNDAALSDFYQHLAQAQSRLGRTREAVDAASAAIICWGPRNDQRTYAIQGLAQALGNAKDLDEYVKHLDTESAKTGQDSPILRKEIAKVYQSRGNLPQAIAQYELAIALQPLDREVHQALIVCYDGVQQPDKATRQLMALIEFDRHDLKLFTQLADRMKANEAEAERAATSIIEAAPNEAENHAAMAELRQQQNRWDESLPHWEQVAELRRLEPNGLLKLASAQVHLKQWDAARTTINKLNKTEWPARFSNTQNEIRQLQEKLPK